MINYLKRCWNHGKPDHPPCRCGEDSDAGGYVTTTQTFSGVLFTFLFLPMMQVAINSKTRLGSAVIGTLRESGLKGFLAGLAPR